LCSKLGQSSYNSGDLKIENIALLNTEILGIQYHTVFILATQKFILFQFIYFISFIPKFIQFKHCVGLADSF